MVIIQKVLVSCSLIFLPFFAFSKTVYFDEGAIKSGYTIQAEDFEVGVPGDVLCTPTKVNVRKTTNYIKPELELISDVFIYNFKTSPQVFFDKKISLALKYDKNSKYSKSVYYFDGVTQSWLKLDTKISEENKTAFVETVFPFAIVAVLQDRSKLMWPAKGFSFTNFDDYYAKIDSGAMIAIDEKSNKKLWGKNVNKKWSLASLTKLMTAYVFLSTTPNLSKVVSYDSSWDKEGAKLHVSSGETMTLHDLLYTMLIGSANNAAYALANVSGLGLDGFVASMNSQAKKWKLKKTKFVDPSGLDEKNVSTVKEYAQLAKKALKNSEILQATTTSVYEFSTINTGIKHTIKNSNELLTKYSFGNISVDGGKTGFIYESLYNLMTRAQVNGHDVIAVVFGNPTSCDRFDETYYLIKWAFNNWQWAN